MSKAKKPEATAKKPAVKAAKKAVRTKHRSPNYPAIALRRAVDLANSIYTRDRMAKIPIAVAHDRLGVKRHSGLGNQLVAAMKAYGLLNVDGKGEKREVQLTDRAHRIVLNASDRSEMLRKAAVEPAINQKLWAKYGETGLPQNDVLREFLIWTLKFNSDTVAEFIKDFSDTVRFAGLTNQDIIQPPADDPTEGDDGESCGIIVGDFVQWNSRGVAQFFAPKQVIALSDDGLFAFFEDSETGIPLAELEAADPADSTKLTDETPKPPLRSPVNPLFKSSRTNPDGSGDMTQAAEQTAARKGPEKPGQLGIALAPNQATRKLPVTLPSLRVAVLEVPFPMSAADYKALSNALALFEDALTVKCETPATE
jgi:hypothetical protein